MTTQAPLWEQTINGLSFSEDVSNELIDFIDGHAADAEESPQDYITDTFESEAEMVLDDAPECFGFTMADVMRVQEAFWAS